MIVHNSLYLLAWMTLTDHNQSLAISKQLFEKWFESVTGRRSKQPLLRSKISNEEKNPTLIGRGISKFVLIEFLNSLGETFVYIYLLCSTRHSVITLSVNLQQEREEKKISKAITCLFSSKLNSRRESQLRMRKIIRTLVNQSH